MQIECRTLLGKTPFLGLPCHHNDKTGNKIHHLIVIPYYNAPGCPAQSNYNTPEKNYTLKGIKFPRVVGMTLRKTAWAILLRIKLWRKKGPPYH